MKFKEGDHIRAKKDLPRGGIPKGHILIIGGLYNDVGDIYFYTNQDTSVYDTSWAWNRSEVNDLFELVEEMELSVSDTKEQKIMDGGTHILNNYVAINPEELKLNDMVIFWGHSLSCETERSLADKGDIPTNHLDYRHFVVDGIYKVTKIVLASHGNYIDVIGQDTNGNQRSFHGYSMSSFVKPKQTKINKNNNTNMNTLINKFKTLTRSEPNKSFVKAGVLDEELNLTSEGKELFINWLFQENATKFNQEVVQEILKEEKTL